MLREDIAAADFIGELLELGWTFFSRALDRVIGFGWRDACGEICTVQGRISLVGTKSHSSARRAVSRTVAEPIRFICSRCLIDAAK